ncbi:MAG: secondary thiamine-phosphate synthase enzyme YjbQ [Acidobacteriia bacterium]|nr:secondary thiamine-phosphate synthase enzyme YjbQ [Terriglobia bacterium]
MVSLRVKTARRTQLLDITREVQKAVAESTVNSGVCTIYVPHTTAGVIINEHADPDVASDMEAAFDQMAPREGNYRHAEGNSDSHIKTALTGTSQVVLVEGGKLALGRWQGIFFCEFDGPRERTVWVKIGADRDRG